MKRRIALRLDLRSWAITLLRALGGALLTVWAAVLFGLGVVVGALVTLILFSVAALVAGYRKGRYE